MVFDVPPTDEVRADDVAVEPVIEKGDTLPRCSVKNPNGSMLRRDEPTSNGLKYRICTFAVPRVVAGASS